jgi:hypothetical protein
VADQTPNADLSIVELARKRFERAKSFYGPARTLAVADTQFAMGDSDNGYQWPADMKRQRELSQKVCLTVNVTAQHCNQIINNIRQNRPGCRVTPVDSGADKKTAEMLAGLWRNIRTASAADDATDNAAEHAIYGGEGYWRVVTEYESERSFTQVIRIKQVRNPQLVFIDPDATELDRSDAKWGFVFEDVNKDEAARDYPGIDMASWSDEVKKTGWIDGDQVRIAEYFWCDREKSTAYLMPDGSVVLESDGKPTKGHVDKREVMVPRWYWCKLVGGHDQPVQKRDWPGRYLPIITCVGKELDVDGEVIRKGIVRDLKDPARMVNYSFSETIQTVALQNKAPYLASAESISGHESEWAKANTENLAYLPFNAYDDDGNPLPQPQRQMPPMMAEAQVKTLALSVEQMRAASGQQAANFGIKSEAQSGIGIRRLQAQSEVATFHFPDNLRRALRYEGKVVIDLIQKVYDTKRVVRILGLDNKPMQATLDPQAAGYTEQQGDDEIERIFNPTVGLYDVVVDTGPSYQTQREEAFAALTELAGKDPNLMAVAGDLIMGAGDFPMADQLAKRLAKTIPANLREGEDLTDAERMQVQLQETMQKLAQAEAAMQQQGQMLDQLQREREAKAMELESKERIAAGEQQARVEQALADRDVELAKIAQRERELEAEQEAERYEAQTRRLQARVQGVQATDVRRIVQQMLGGMAGPAGAAPRLGMAPGADMGEGEPMEGPGPDGSPMHELAEGEVAPQVFDVQTDTDRLAASVAQMGQAVMHLAAIVAQAPAPVHQVIVPETVLQPQFMVPAAPAAPVQVSAPVTVEPAPVNPPTPTPMRHTVVERDSQGRATVIESQPIEGGE